MQTIIIHGQSQRDYLRTIIDKIPTDYAVEIKEVTRTVEQNSKMWPMLGDLSRQVNWHGYILSDEEWKDFFTAILCGQKFVPNLDRTGFVIVGRSSRKLGKKKFSELIELIQHFGDERGVVWSNNAP